MAYIAIRAFEAMQEAAKTGAPTQRGRRGAGTEARRCIARARARTARRRDARRPCSGVRPLRHGLHDRRTRFAREDLLRETAGRDLGLLSNCGFARRPLGYGWSLCTYRWIQNRIVLDVAGDQSCLSDVAATRNTPVI